MTTFSEMQHLMNQHCVDYMQTVRRLLEEAGATADSTAAVGELVIDACKAPAYGKRSHKRRALPMLPPYGIVDMTMGGKPWSPLCLLVPKAANVSMEATTENFMKLFEVVHDRRIENLGKHTVTRTPTRTIRRRKSEPFAPKRLPDGTMFHVATKRWLRCVMSETPTPGSGSGSD